MTDSSTKPTDRFIRQSGFVPAAKMAEANIAVIGVGAIGRQVAIQLVAMGVRRLTIIDFDTVEDHNRTTQGYRLADVGMKKVEALKAALLEIDPECEVTAIDDVYRGKYSKPQMFCCVDSIKVRQSIWENGGKASRFYADGRMLGEVMRILAVSSDPDAKYYPKTLFAPEQAQQGACTARSTIYTSGIAAGLMIQQFTRYLRGYDVDRDMSLNLLAGELTVADFDANTEPAVAAAEPVVT